MNSSYISTMYKNCEFDDKPTINPPIMGHPVPLLEHKGDCFELNPRAFDQMLEQKDLLGKKLIVISIFGEYRKGKSFFLNYIIRYLRNYQKENWIEEDTDLMGFSSKGGLKRVTDGIVIWSHAFPYRDEYAVVLVDTEGTHDEVSKMTKMSQVFSCCALTSNVLIYNVNKSIYKKTTDELQCFCEFARKDVDISEFGELMVLVRDWPYVSELSYGLHSGKEHLEHWIKADIEGAGKTLNECFTKKECFLMPRPGEYIRGNEKESEEKIAMDTMDVKFLQNLQEVIEHILNPDNFKVKITKNKEVKLKKISKVFTENITLILKSDVTLKSLGQVQKEEVTSTAMKKVVSKYKDDMENKLKSEITKFKFIEFEMFAHEEALEMFDKATQQLGKSIYCTYRPQLIKELRCCKIQYNNLHNTLQKSYKDLRKKDKEIKALKEQKLKMSASTPEINIIKNSADFDRKQESGNISQFNCSKSSDEEFAIKEKNTYSSMLNLSNIKTSKTIKSNQNFVDMQEYENIIHSMYENRRDKIRNNEIITEEMKEKELEMSETDEKFAIEEIKRDLELSTRQKFKQFLKNYMPNRVYNFVSVYFKDDTF